MDDEMLRALCNNYVSPETIAPTITLEEQYKYMVKNINFLPFNIRKKLCNILVYNNQSQAISDCNEGVAISMNIPDDIITQMYDLTYFELSRI